MIQFLLTLPMPETIQYSVAPNKPQQAQHLTGIKQKTFIRGAKKSIYKPKFQMTEDMDDLDDGDDDEDNDEPVKSTFDEITEHEHENQFIETIDYANIDIHDDGDEIIAEVLEAESVAHSSQQSKDDFLSAQYITVNENNQVFFESPPNKMIKISTTKSPQKTSDNGNSHTNVIDCANPMDRMKQF